MMNPGNGAAFAPETATGARLFRRFNATAHMPTQTSSRGSEFPGDKLDLSKVQ
jgi:hypothetical protein